MGYWLKLVYNRQRRTQAPEWRHGLPWISDHHRRRGDRAIQRPSYRVGDEVVVYSVHDRVCPARLRVAVDPEFDPARVEREGSRADAKRWGWLTEVEVLATADLDRSPTLREIDVDPSSTNRADHIRLTTEQYRRARHELPSGKNGRAKRVRHAPVEASNVESFEHEVEPRTRRVALEEKRLVTAYSKYLESKGRTVDRHVLANPTGTQPLRTDLYEHERGNLIEAKARITRAAIRMAIGQLADYGRLLESPPNRRAVLLPKRPDKDYLELLESQGILAVWRSRRGFTDNSGGLLT